MEFEYILYVGDSYDNDIVGVCNGGWYFFWFNYCFCELLSC